MAPSRRRFFTTIASAVLVPAAIFACNGIIGLDEYDRVQCTGLVCEGGIPSEGGPGTDAGDSGKFDGGQGTDPVSWARWPMPNYFLDAGSVTAPDNPPDLKPSGPEVSDQKTDLVWRSTMQNEGAKVTFATAQEACRQLSTQEGATWRLPKRIELVTLLDYGHPPPHYNASVFPQFALERVWTSSEVRPIVAGAPRYWTVSFDSGAVENFGASEKAAATLCVKAK